MNINTIIVNIFTILLQFHYPFFSKTSSAKFYPFLIAPSARLYPPSDDLQGDEARVETRRRTNTASRIGAILSLLPDEPAADVKVFNSFYDISNIGNW